MSKLTLMLDGKYIREYSIEDDVTTIGRRSSNTISTDSSDLAVSGTHARIVFILDEHFIEDLESTNGTYVNGKPIKKHNLKEGDVIAFGRHTLKYSHGDEEITSDNHEEKMDDTYEPTVLDTQTSATDLQVDTEESISPYLKILSGPNSGQELKIIKNLTTLGKPGQQIGAISRRDNDEYFFLHVETVGNIDKPLLNGASIQEPAPLKPSDVIELAGVKLEFIQP